MTTIATDDDEKDGREGGMYKMENEVLLDRLCDFVNERASGCAMGLRCERT